MKFVHLILNAGTQTIPAPQCSAVRFQHLEVPCRQRLCGEWHINPTGSSHCSRKGLVAANLRLSIEIDHVLQCLSVGFLRFWGHFPEPTHGCGWQKPHRARSSPTMPRKVWQSVQSSVQDRCPPFMLFEDWWMFCTIGGECFRSR